MASFGTLAAELGITSADPQVWLSIGEGLLFFGVSLALGIWVSRWVGLLDSRAPIGETIAVGLSCGLLVEASWAAAVMSGGRSSFTPVAIGFAVSLFLAGVPRYGRGRVVSEGPPTADVGAPGTPELSHGRRSWPAALVLSAAFIVAIGLVYGATLAPSPRDGLQPVEGPDEALYAVLSRDLATTGTEATSLPSGLGDIPGLPPQTWYHWGELWLTAASIDVFGADPLPARFFVVLPSVLLAAASLTGTLVRRWTGTTTRRAFGFGFAVSLFLAPFPLATGAGLSQWPTGMIFSITVYGLGAVAALLVLYGLVVWGQRPRTSALAVFCGTAVAALIPTHIVIAAVALIGLACAVGFRVLGDLIAKQRPRPMPRAWRGVVFTAAIITTATVVWGLATGHGIASSAVQATVAPFNTAWLETVVFVALGAGCLWLIPAAWLLFRGEAPREASLYVGTMSLLLMGAVIWGARLADFNMLYVFFAGLTVFATPIAALGAWRIVQRLRPTRARALALVIVALLVAQVELGVYKGLIRLQEYGPHLKRPISTDLLRAIDQLPAGARLAYACYAFEEASSLEPQLLSIDAHTDRRVVPMCFQADIDSTLIGAPVSAEAPSASFRFAPQRSVYPTAGAVPIPSAVLAFLKQYGIRYIYADESHPNTLVPDAVVVARSTGAEVLETP